jgi:hypothetical protein
MMKGQKNISDELWQKLFGRQPGQDTERVNTKIARLLIEQFEEGSVSKPDTADSSRNTAPEP